MHVILGALGLIVSILVLVNRLSRAGIDIGWLDPFKWSRRQKWKQSVNVNPVYTIEDPMKSTAGLMYTMVRCSGDISREEKAFLLSIFKDDFKLTDKESRELLSTCSFYIKDEDTVKNNLQKFMRASINNFAGPQKESAFSLIEKVAFCEGNPNEKQSEFLNEIRDFLMPQNPKFKEW